MPAANQARPFALRMRRTGLAHPFGAGDRWSSILKSPFAASGTAASVFRSTKGDAASQISVAKTLALSVRADAVAPGQKQALAFDLNVPARLNVGPQIGDHPELARRVDAADHVPGDVGKASIGVRGSRNVRGRVDTDPALESDQRVPGVLRILRILRY